MIDSKKTEELARRMLDKENELFFDEDEIGSEEYNEAMKRTEDIIHYLNTSPLFTLKSKKDSEGENVLYVTMNQEEVGKHEHKEIFNEMIENWKKYYDEEVRESDGLWAEDIKQTGVLEEKDFLEILDAGDDIESFYDGMQNNEQGIVPKPKEPKPVSEACEEPSDPLADDNGYQAWLYRII